MKTFYLVVPGEPVGKARPRVTRFVTYTPKKTLEYENRIRHYASLYNLAPITDQCSLKISAYFSVPKYYSKKRKANCLSGLEKPTKKPDIDNVAKSVLDALNPKFKVNKATRHRVMISHGIYEDDKLVTDLEVHKFYSVTPRTEIEITWEEDE